MSAEVGNLGSVLIRFSNYETTINKSWVFMGNVVNPTLNNPEYLGVVVKNTLVGGFKPSAKS